MKYIKLLNKNGIFTRNVRAIKYFVLKRGLIGEKNRISLFFVESPDFFHGSPDFPFPGVGRSVSWDMVIDKVIVVSAG